MDFSLPGNDGGFLANGWSSHQEGGKFDKDHSNSGPRARLLGLYEEPVEDFSFVLDEDGDSSNDFYRATKPLLIFVCDLDRITEALGYDENSSPNDIYKALAPEVQRLCEGAAENLLSEIGVSRIHAQIAHYALCCFIDERILSTPWGAKSQWAEYPLLLKYHDDSYGGVRFFNRLEALSPSDSGERDLIDFKLLLLSLGYLGKYGTVDNNRTELGALVTKLRQSIDRENNSSTSGGFLLNPVARTSVFRRRMPVSNFIYLSIFVLGFFSVTYCITYFTPEFFGLESEKIRQSFEQLKIGLLPNSITR